MTSPSPRPLSRPRADTIELTDLLSDARRGRFAIPWFQRGLQWKAEDRRKLFDSIYRGFPIGNLLLWQPEMLREGATPRGREDFGPFQPEHLAQSRLWVVDGQQRLITLLGCLARSPSADAERFPLPDWAFAFDTDRREVVRVDEGDVSAQPGLLPVEIAIDTRRYLNWTRALPADAVQDARMSAGDDFSKALQTYKIPYYTILTDDMSTVMEVFVRTNTTGRALRASDVFGAIQP